MAIRVGVVGAAGRMGQMVCRSVLGAADLELVAAVSPRHARLPLAQLAGLDTSLVLAGELDALTEANAEVAVDFTVPDAVGDNVSWYLEHRVHAVVGTTGWTGHDLDRFRELSRKHGANAVVAPNFALGAVLMMSLAQLAARHLPDVEIVELHHDAKRDAPSGTALRTADLISAARRQTFDREAPGGGGRAGQVREAAAGGGRAGQPRKRPTVPEVVEQASKPETDGRGAERSGIRVHAVRLPGLVAHQEVLFGAQGQTLTIRHDAVDRTAFMPGVLLAVREVAAHRGLIVGLERLLGLEARGEADPDQLGGETPPGDDSEVTR